jgi:hypothetical protein
LAIPPHLGGSSLCLIPPARGDIDTIIWAYLTTLPVHLDGPLSAYLLVGTLLCICPVSPK